MNSLREQPFGFLEFLPALVVKAFSAAI